MSLSLNINYGTNLIAIINVNCNDNNKLIKNNNQIIDIIIYFIF